MPGLVDIAMVDVTASSMRPVRDPIRSMIYAAAERAVRHVFVGGEQVVTHGKVTTMNLEEAAAALEEAQRRLEPNVAKLDWARRSHLDISPLVYVRE